MVRLEDWLAAMQGKYITRSAIAFVFAFVRLGAKVVSLWGAGLGWKSWKRRWFLLTRTSLVFFKMEPVHFPALMALSHKRIH